MQTRYVLSPKPIAALRALGENLVEISPAEIAVFARLLPGQVDAALAALERLGLVTVGSAGNGSRLVALTNEGRFVLQGLTQYRGIPPLGTVVPLPRLLPSLSKWSGTRDVQRVEIGADETESVSPL